MGRLHRTQLLLAPKQHQLLADVAQTEGRSVSDLLREIVDQYLAERESQNCLQRHIQAVEALTGIRKKLEREHGVIHRDLLAEARSERDEDFARIWKDWNKTE